MLLKALSHGHMKATLLDHAGLLSSGLVPAQIAAGCKRFNWITPPAHLPHCISISQNNTISWRLVWSAGFSTAANTARPCTSLAYCVMLVQANTSLGLSDIWQQPGLRVSATTGVGGGVSLLASQCWPIKSPFA